MFPEPAPVPAPTHDSRVTERRNPRTVDIDLALPLAIVDLINAEDQGVADAVATQREPIAASIALIEAAFRAGDASLARALTDVRYRPRDGGRHYRRR